MKSELTVEFRLRYTNEISQDNSVAVAREKKTSKETKCIYTHKKIHDKSRTSLNHVHCTKSDSVNERKRERKREKESGSEEKNGNFQIARILISFT